MGYFPATAAAAAAGENVCATLLVKLSFASQTVWLWQGYGTLYAGGQWWSGLGKLGSVSGLESALGGSAPQVTLTLSGVDPTLVAEALNSSSEVKGRDATVLIQFFDANMQTLDAPYALWAGTMDLMTIKASGPATRTIELTAETLFTRRGVPPWGYLSDRSQQGLYPGDTGLDQMASMPWRSVSWPVF